MRTKRTILKRGSPGTSPTSAASLRERFLVPLPGDHALLLGAMLRGVDATSTDITALESGKGKGSTGHGNAYLASMLGNAPAGAVRTEPAGHAETKTIRVRP
jgi:hypothetical protein